MNVILSQQITLTDVPDALRRRIEERLTIENPKWIENNKMSRWQGETSRHLHYYEETENGLTLPRGFAGQLISMAKRAGLSYKIDDRRRMLPEVDFTFTGTLKPFQQEAVTAMLKKDFGTLSAPTGSGKTVVACYLIAKRRQSALIVVHSKELLEQWIARIGQFLDIPRDEVGIIGNGKKLLGERITVGIINSIYPIADQIKEHFGHLVVDECHRTPSRTFTEACSAFDSRFMLGLSATPWRRDGLSKLIFWYVGDVQHQVDQGALVENGDILRADVVIRETDFNSHADPQEAYSRMLSELTEDVARNRLIAGDIRREAIKSAGVCLVLSDRKAHCEAIASLLHDSGISVDVLTGGTPDKARKAIVERLSAGDVRVLIATGQLIGEGFDCKGLSVLFLTTPIKFDGRLIQYLGRVLRPAPGKSKAKVYDYVDANIGVLAASARSRQRVYSRLAAGGEA